MKIKNTEIIFVKGKSAEQQVDAIVLSLLNNCQLRENVVDVLGDEKTKALVGVFNQRLPLSPQEAIYLNLDYFKARAVIGVICDFKGVEKPEQYLRECYAKIFHRVNQQKMKVVVLPDLGTAKEAFPKQGAAKIMAQEILRYVRSQGHHAEKLIICIEDEAAFDCFHKEVLGYLSHIEDDLGEGPYVTVDVIIEMMDGIILIERSNPPYGWALPGGFVDVGESLEAAVVREAKEETNLGLEDLKQFHVYSGPKRDPRFHTVSTVFVAKGVGVQKAGDDAKGIKTISYEKLLGHAYAFDHFDVIKDYLDRRWG